MKKALEYIVMSIVETPQEVEISENEDNGMVNFTIKVASSDMGRIIGKNGKVIRGIRNAIKILAIKQNKRINIALSETPSE
ncbi:MAG: KH domain-containing protein [Candidatus Levybacteria bacterium]|nr:KH domain-containing protein [Candidatus Levybacteria bacterium]